MRVEIDQSGKFEQLNTHTVLSLANDINFSIYLTTIEKIKIIKLLRKSIIPRNDRNALIFSILVFILISKSKKCFGTVYIDIEYSGKEKIIKNTIETLAGKFKYKNLPMIRFMLVGKSSNAHELAIGVYRKRDKKKSYLVKSSEVVRCLSI